MGSIAIKIVKALRALVLAAVMTAGGALSAHASYIPFNTNVAGNIGIGTTTPQGSFVVTGGNVGIGTWAPTQALDVNGTVRATYFVGNGAGITGLIPSQWTTTNTNDVYLPGNGNVGLGTTLTNQGAALSVMNGNVGIGTWVPGSTLDVVGNIGIDARNSSGSNYATIGFLNTLATTNTRMRYDFDGGFGGLQSGYNQTVQLYAYWGLRIEGSRQNNTPYSLSSVAGTTTDPSLTVVQGKTTTPGMMIKGIASIASDYFQIQSSAGLGGDIFDVNSSGNVGIGTFAPNGKLIVSGGNVGIGSLVPGQVLDVQGTVRMTGFQLIGNGASAGNVLVTNAVGVGTWMPTSSLTTSSQWTTANTNDVYLSNNGNVGIGTTITSAGAALTVMNGNVGIGTWVPGEALDVNGYINMRFGQELLWSTDTNHYITAQPTGMTIHDINGVTVEGAGSPNPGLIVKTGNVGIGSTTPGQTLDVSGTARMTGFQLTGNGVSAGNVLVTNAVGIGTWVPPSTLTTSSQWTTANTNDVYLSNNGNVGIGTTITSAGAALTVMNGNVGIGTWIPSSLLTVGNGKLTVDSSGNISSTSEIFFGKGYFSDSGLGLLNINDAVRGQVQVTAFFNNITPLLVKGTAGQTADILQVQNNTPQTLFNVTAAGNVGIGTWIPGRTLDVSGTVRATGLAMPTGSPSIGYVLTASTTNGDAVWSAAGSVSGWTSGAGTLFTTTSTNNVGIGTSTPQGGLVVTNGNVGIGTWAPSTMLHVAGGSIRTDGEGTGLIVDTGASNKRVGLMKYGGYEGALVAGNSTVLRMGHITNNADITQSSQLRVDEYIDTNGNIGIGTTTVQGGLAVMNGNVGIGTWAPGNPLVVKASYGSMTYDALGEMVLTGVSGTTGNIFSVNYGGAGNPFAVDRTDIYLDNFSSSTGPFAISAGSHTTQLDYKTTNAAPMTFSPNSTEAMRIVNGGNIGIGTVTPVSRLSVVGNIGIGTGVNSNYVNTSAPTGGMIVEGNVGIGTWLPNSNLQISNTSGFPRRYLTMGVVGASTDWAFWLGNEAINNLYIGSDLSATGFFWRANWSTAGVAANTFQDANNVGNATTIVEMTHQNAGDTGDYLHVTTNGGTTGNVFDIANGGNVGIGTTVPGQVLDVKGTVRATGLAMPTGSPAIGYVLTAATTNGDAVWSAAGAVSGWTSGSGALYSTTPTNNVGIGTTTPQGGLVVTNGNVGIGTWAPVAPLSVNGNGVFGNFTSSGSSTPLTVSFGGTYGTGSPGSFGNLKWIMWQDAATESNHDYGIGMSPSLMEFQAGATGGHEFFVNGGTAAMSISKNGGLSLGSSYASNDAGSGNMIIQNNIGIGTTIINAGAALAVMNGNVGIGTWVPGAALDLNGNMYVESSNKIYLNNGAGIYWTPAGGSVTLRTNNIVAVNTELAINGSYLDSGAGMLMIQPAATTTAGIVTAAKSGQTADQMHWEDSSGNILGEINSAGNIGIGTSKANNSLIVGQGNVGIGSLAPGQALDVQGTIRTTGLTVSTGSPAIGYVLTATDTSGDAVWSAASTVGGWTVKGNDVYEASGGNVGIGTTLTTTSGLTVMDGNVGIGTWVPQGALTVMNGNVGIGVANPTDTLSLNGNIRTPNGIIYFSNNNNDWISGSTSEFMTLGTNGRERLRIDSTGNVGIGTVNPQGGLIVMNGNVGIGTWIPKAGLDLSGLGANVTSLALPGGSFSDGSAGTLIGYVSFSGNFFVNGGNLAVTGDFLSSSTGSVPVKIQGNAGQTADLQQWQNSSGVVLDDVTATGNVGIGTWLPAETLQVKGTIEATQFDYANGNGPLADSNGYLYVPQALFDNSVSPGTNGECLLSTGTGVTWGSCSGSVGVGTTSPGSPLNSVQFNDNGFFAGSPNFMFNGNNVGIGTVLSKNTLDVANNVSIGTSYAGYHSAPADGLIVQANVGIGTWTPGYAMDVRGAAGATWAFIGAPSSDGAGIDFKEEGGLAGEGGQLDLLTGGTARLTLAANSGSNSSSSVSSSGQLSLSGLPMLFSGASEVARFDASGNLGIGTQTPAGRLVVMSGNVGIGTWVPANALQVGTNIFGVDASLGNVGIGTLSPPVGFEVVKDGTVSAFQHVSGISGNHLMEWRDSTGTAQSYMNNTGSAYSGQTIDLGGTIGGGNGGLLSVSQGQFQGGDEFQVVSYGGNQLVGMNVNSNLAYFKTNVGIGTDLTSGSARLAVIGGNVGIGSLTPGQVLDVQGTVRTVGFAMPTGSPSIGYVLTASTTKGDAVWSAAGSVGGWTVSGNDVYETAKGNVGIGTTLTTTSALTVMNGNVGIGTWNPGGSLIVQGGNVGIGTTTPPAALYVVGNGKFTGSVTAGSTTLLGYDSNGNATIGGNFTVGSVDINSPNGLTVISGDDLPLFGGRMIIKTTGNVGIGTTLPSGLLEVGNQKFDILSGGNVGIGSITPGQALDVNGTVRATAFVGNGAGLTGITGTTQWTTTNTNDVYLPNSGNVGLGTTMTKQAALTVMNGNVGIGTWVPGSALAVNGQIVASGGGIAIDASGGDIYAAGNLGLGNTLDFTNVGRLRSLADGTLQMTNHNNNGFIQLQFGSNTSSFPALGVSGANLSLMSGDGSFASNLGIGTTNASSGRLIVTGGNVGIGSLTPGQALDVQGTLRATYFVGNGAGLTNLPSSSQWTTTNTNDVYLSNSGNVGLGTSLTTTAALTVMNGNVGIGTWVPGAALAFAPSTVPAGGINFGDTSADLYRNGVGGLRTDGNLLVLGQLSTASNLATYSVQGQAGTALSIESWTSEPIIFYTNAGTTQVGDWASNGNLGIGTFGLTTPGAVLTVAGNVGIGTVAGDNFTSTAPPSGGMMVEGNVGIGSLSPGQKLDVTGTVRATYFVGNGAGLTNLPGGSQWTTTNTNDVYLPNNGNVGLGTTLTSTSALTIMNGNVGIGTWVPGASLFVKGNVGIGTSGPYLNKVPPIGGLFTQGNVGISTWVPQGTLDVEENTKTGINFSINSYTVGSPAAVVYANTSNSDGMFVQDVTGDQAALAQSAQNIGVLGKSNGAGYGVLGVDGNGNSGGLGDRSDNAGVYANGTSYGVLSLGPMNYFSGNMGIGTSISANRLDVQGGVGIGTAYAGYVGAPSNGLIVQGNVGIGSSAPGVSLDVNGAVRSTVAGTSYFLGNVGIGTQAPGNNLEVNGSARFDGHVNVAGGSSPSSGTCCTGNGTIASGSTDFVGRITFGTGTCTSCTVNFGTSFTNTPFCTVTLGGATESTIYISSISSSSFTVNMGTSAPSDSATWACYGATS